MKRVDRKYLFGFVLAFTLPHLSVSASEATDSLLKEYQQSAESIFSAQAGESLWNKVVNERSCTSCHSTSVNNLGKHKRTGKIIEPMSPTVNPMRLTDEKKIKKWFLRNCKWTFGRECNAQEKGNILLWLSKQ